MTFEEQIAGGDLFPIDPKLIKLVPEVPVTIGFEMDRKLGKTTRTWEEGGRIMFEAEVNELESFLSGRPDAHPDVLADTAAIGFTIEQYDEQNRLMKGGTLFAVGLTDENENRNQPKWEVIE